MTEAAARLIGTNSNVLKLVKSCELSEQNRTIGIGKSITFQLGHDCWQGVVLFRGGNLQFITPSNLHCVLSNVTDKHKLNAYNSVEYIIDTFWIISGNKPNEKKAFICTHTTPLKKIKQLKSHLCYFANNCLKSSQGWRNAMKKLWIFS
jgi:hypothetical protein